MFSCCLLHKKWVLFLISPFLIWYASHDRKGFGNLMFPCGVASWVVLLSLWTWVLPFCSLYSPFFGCFCLIMIGGVSSFYWFASSVGGIFDYNTCHMGQSLWLPNRNYFILFGKPCTLCLKPNLVSEYLNFELHPNYYFQVITLLPMALLLIKDIVRISISVT
jgi:hypothetical protein